MVEAGVPVGQASTLLAGVVLIKALVRPNVTVPELDISVASVSARLAMTAAAE